MMKEHRLGGYRGIRRRRMVVDIPSGNLDDLKIRAVREGSTKSAPDSDIVLDLPRDFYARGSKLHVLQPGESLDYNAANRGDYVLVVSIIDG